MPTRNDKSQELEPRVVVSEDTKHADVRLALARMYIGVAQITRTRMPKGDLTDVVITAAVTVGTIEGRPMSAAKIAHYTGMPRATVLRRLKRLIQQGYISRKGNTFVSNRMPVISSAFIRRFIRLLEPAVKTLSVHNGHF
jgi:hypothetical protein